MVSLELSRNFVLIPVALEQGLEPLFCHQAQRQTLLIVVLHDQVGLIKPLEWLLLSINLSSACINNILKAFDLALQISYSRFFVVL